MRSPITCVLSPSMPWWPTELHTRVHISVGTKTETLFKYRQLRSARPLGEKNASRGACKGMVHSDDIMNTIRDAVNAVPSIASLLGKVLESVDEERGGNWAVLRLDFIRSCLWEWSARRPDEFRSND